MGSSNYEPRPWGDRVYNLIGRLLANSNEIERITVETLRAKSLNPVTYAEAMYRILELIRMVYIDAKELEEIRKANSPRAQAARERWSKENGND